MRISNYTVNCAGEHSGVTLNWSDPVYRYHAWLVKGDDGVVRLCSNTLYKNHIDPAITKQWGYRTRHLDPTSKRWAPSVYLVLKEITEKGLYDEAVKSAIEKDRANEQARHNDKLRLLRQHIRDAAVEKKNMALRTIADAWSNDTILELFNAVHDATQEWHNNNR